jgi:Outer membrane protein beta-barrel domain
MLIRRTVAIGFALMLLTPAGARADGLIVPFAGVNFGGDAGETFGDAADASRFDWGASFAWMGGGVFGFEADLGYSPDFYGKNDVGGSSVLSLMGNVLLGVPFGGQQGFGIRPYGLVGVGVLRSDLESFDELVGFDNTEIAWNFGGGVFIFFTSHVGIRGDLRYFRTFGDVDFGPIETSDSDAVDYGRGSIGLVFRF